MAYGIVCRKYQPGPASDTIVILVLPETLLQQVMIMCHDSPAAGHQGTYIKDTTGRIWVNMERHCSECVTCQKSKLLMPEHPNWTTMPDDCDRHPVCPTIKNGSYTGQFYQIGRHQTAPRADSHKDHSSQGQAASYRTYHKLLQTIFGNQEDFLYILRTPPLECFNSY